MTAAQQAIQTYRQQKAAAETAYRQNNRPTVYFRDHIAAAETLLQTLWQIHFPDSNDISLIAIGGFGRCELYPHSDWDLAIISSTPFQTACNNKPPNLSKPFGMHASIPPSKAAA